MTHKAIRDGLSHPASVTSTTVDISSEDTRQDFILEAVSRDGQINSVVGEPVVMENGTKVPI